METLLQDIRYAARRLLKSPGFTIVAVLTLALGIGANSAIFSVVNAVLLRSLPFAEPDRLVMLYTGYPDDETRYPLSAPDFMSYHDDARSFSDVVAASGSQQTLTGAGEPRRVEVGVVTADFFELMGARPILGRTFRAEENEPGSNTVAVLSHAYWQQQFGADAGRDREYGHAKRGSAGGGGGAPTRVRFPRRPPGLLPAGLQLDLQLDDRGGAAE